MAFENFPYTNFHEINLDWIVARVKEAYSASNPPDYPVKSVNGMTGDVIIAIPANLVQSVNGETGDVILYRNPLVQFPTTDENRWNLFRICDGDARGIEFDEDGAHRIEGTRRILIYDEENQPDYPVTSVNGQTGDVRITAGVNSVNGKTGNVVTPFVNPNTDILKLDSNSNTVLWGISRDVAGGNVALYISRGTGTPQAFIRYTPDQGEAVNLPLLSSADIPESAGVVSVNTKTGAVTLYGTDILLSETSSENITNIINSLSQNLNNINDKIFIEKTGDSLTWYQGFINSTNGSLTAFNKTIVSQYVNNNLCKIIQPTNMPIAIFGWENGTFKGVYDKNNNTFLIASSSNYYFTTPLDFYKLTSQFPAYNFRIQTKYYPESETRPEDSRNITFIMYRDTQDVDITNLENTVTEHTQQISALQEADTTHTQQISALQTADTTHEQQISALQTKDTTHEQQISALQTKDTTHEQQISALQTKDNIQDQQISELYTRAGVYVISITNANTLPLRYPASGTDEKIKDINKVVSMDLSIPAAQVSNWTITTYDGYLEITGTMNGGTNITLYLA